MSAVAAAIGGASLVGAGITANSAADASRAQNQAATAANQMSFTQWQKQQADMQPWLDSGKANLATLNSSMPDLTRKFSMDDFHQDPGYQFQLEQGKTAMERSAAARGMLSSTGTQQNLNNYAQGAANTDYQQALKNFTDNQTMRFNMLSGLAGTGQAAGNSLAQGGQNFANAYGGNLMGGANASAAASMAQGNAVNGAIGSGSNAYMTGQLMNRFAPQQQPSMTAPSSGGWDSGGWNGGSAPVTPLE